MITKIANSKMWKADPEVVIFAHSCPSNTARANEMVDTDNVMREVIKDWTSLSLPEVPTDESDPHFYLKTSEFAGRLCYDSFHKPNPATKEPRDYLLNIAKQNHLSVLEHVHLSLLFCGVSRSFTHEIVRHRHFSFSQESQRYVLQKPFIAVPPNATVEEQERIANQAEKAYKTYLKMTNKGWHETGLSRKQTLEKARAVLPNCFTTRIMVSGNLRSWIEFLQKRDSLYADAEMQAVAAEVRKVLEEFLDKDLGTGFFKELMEALEPGSVEQKGPKEVEPA